MRNGAKYATLSDGTTWLGTRPRISESPRSQQLPLPKAVSGPPLPGETLLMFTICRHRLAIGPSCG